MPSNNEIVSPNEHLIIPKWINADYFKEILEKDEPQYAKVIKFTPTAAIPPGENFTSVMIRIHMELKMKDGTTKAKTYVLKTTLDADKGGDEVDKFELFPKELEMYQKYLPAFEELYKTAGHNIQLAPKCLHTEQNDERINFVFEDLKTKNFQNIDRLKGCNMAEMRRILTKLAEFHAASAVYVEKYGNFSKKFSNGFVHAETGFDMAKRTYDGRINIYKKAMRMWGLEDVESYIAKLPTFEQYWACSLKTLDTTGNSFNVLTHGDFWSSNVMLNYKPDGSIDEVLLVDLQICKWGSPAEDLLFFISISAQRDIRLKEFDHFVEIYYERLIECLKILQYKQRLPKLRELQMAMYQENTSFYAFFACFNHLFVVLLPTDKDSNIHSLMRDDEIGDQFKLRALTNPEFVEAMKDIFPFYYRRGIFNFDDY